VTKPTTPEPNYDEDSTDPTSSNYVDWSKAERASFPNLDPTTPGEFELVDMFASHAKQCSKGNKCCYSPDNGSTQEFIAAILAAHKRELNAVEDILFQRAKQISNLPGAKEWEELDCDSKPIHGLHLAASELHARIQQLQQEAANEEASI
jgi:hypothetical protein